MKTKVKSTLLLVIIVLTLAVGCGCDTDCYEDKGGIHSNGDNAIYLDTE